MADWNQIKNILQKTQAGVLMLVKNNQTQSDALLTTFMSVFFKENNIEHTLYLTKKPIGWLKKLFEDYKIPYKTEFEPLKYIFEVAYSSGENVDVSYDMNEGKFYLFINPGNSKFDEKSVKFSRKGVTADLAIVTGTTSLFSFREWLPEVEKALDGKNYMFISAYGGTNTDATDKVTKERTYALSLTPSALKNFIRSIDELLANGMKLSKNSATLLAALFQHILRFNDTRYKEVYPIIYEKMAAYAKIDSSVIPNAQKLGLNDSPNYAEEMNELIENGILLSDNKIFVSTENNNQDSTSFLPDQNSWVTRINGIHTAVVAQNLDNNLSYVHVESNALDLLNLAQALQLRYGPGHVAGYVENKTFDKTIEIITTTFKEFYSTELHFGRDIQAEEYETEDSDSSGYLSTAQVSQAIPLVNDSDSKADVIPSEVHSLSGLENDEATSTELLEDSTVQSASLNTTQGNTQNNIPGITASPTVEQSPQLQTTSPAQTLQNQSSEPVKTSKGINFQELARKLKQSN